MTRRPRYAGYIAMSLDGFVADADGSVAWLDPFNAAMQGGKSDGGYDRFIAQIDAVVMGRRTYEQIMGWGWPYETRAGYVLTRQNGFSGDHIAASGDIATLRDAIEAAGHTHVWIMGGGETQRAALDAGMFDSLALFLMPTFLGGGRPMMAPGPQHDMTLTASTELPGGILRLDYANKD